MSKNRKLLLLGITLVIVGFFIIIFFSLEEEEYVELDFREKNTFEDPENYEFQELEETTLVTNENLGFSFEVPKDWRLERKEQEENFGYIEVPKGIVFFSPNYHINENDEIEAGCEIGFTILDYTKENHEEYNKLDLLREEIQDYKNGEEPRHDYKKLIEINNYYGVGYFFDVMASDWQKSQNTGNIFVEILIGNRVYNVGAIFSPKDAEECQEKFHNLLDSISFTKNEQ
ncbi:MAG: hypothetical protein K9M12_02060 [Candidatus Pacebacteria bacterium]|nr:hypothetical protein [Candidatus Paceibacterota bacterium]